MPAARLSQPPNLVAIDLGAESCRVSLLQWNGDVPDIAVVHRCKNRPIACGGALHWDLSKLIHEVQTGLQLCADRSRMPIASIGVDGWAVDYVRLNDDGAPIGEPFCYRDERTLMSEDALQESCPAAFLYSQTGVQPLRINTLYQLVADRLAGVPARYRWVNLPEYVLSRLGGRCVAELTNAAHTGLLDVQRNIWNKDVFKCAGLDLYSAPELVTTGTDVGSADAELRKLGVFREARLIAPACHDTASAVAGIAAKEQGWAYISSGTWSLPGALLDQPVTSDAARKAGFTNLRAANGRYCFHKNVNGMWLLQQLLTQFHPSGDAWSMPELIGAAEKVPAPHDYLNVDDPALLLSGKVSSVINQQLSERALPTIPEDISSLPVFANLIFYSLAHRYREVFGDLVRLTGQRLERIYVVGGGSRNSFLNRLTEEATGLPVSCGAIESTTIGNFAVQLAALEGGTRSRDRIHHWASILASSDNC
jgi:rhamnulokinase